MHSVVPGSVGDQQLALEFLCTTNRRRLLVALFLGREKPDVPLCVDRVIQVPIRHGVSGKTYLEDLWHFEHSVQCYLTAIAPAPNPNPFRIGKGLVFQPISAVALVRQFLCPETIVDRFFKEMAASSRASAV